jgi:predicted transcriptional regulator
MAKQGATISEAELEVLRSLWEHGPGTIREIGVRLRARKRRWAYTTVQTLLNRLAAKGYVACDRKDVPHVFRPAVSRDGMVKQRLRAVADQLCEGAASPLVMALVSSHRFSKEEIRQFRQLLGEGEPKSK